MTRLPRELASWAPFLEVFPDEDVRTILPWLPRLNTLVGAIHLASERRSGEADGFNGLTRRGNYDRLVAGEWALLEALPEEFVRRAAMNELLFLKPEWKSPKEAKRSVVLFDAGPDQLGAPRLAHIALFVTIARRAENSRTSLAWGILQDPPDLWDGFSAEHLARLLNARTWETPGPGHMEQWKKCFVSLQPEDLWIVGSSGLAQLPGLHNASTIIVDEPLAVPATFLSVSAARHGNAPHMKVRLELPTSGAGVRLLRASSYPSASGIIQFSWDGRRLLVRGDDASILGYHIPNSSHEPLGNTVRLTPGASETLLAATLEGKSWSWVTLNHLKKGGITVYGSKTKIVGGELSYAGIHERSFACAPVLPPPKEAPVPQLVQGCHFHDGKMTIWGIAFSDGRQGLIGISTRTITLRLERASFCTVSDATSGRSLVVLENHAGRRRLFHTVYGEISAHPFNLHGDGTFAMINSNGPSGQHFGINDSGRRWRFCSMKRNTLSELYDLEAPAGSNVIGWIPKGYDGIESNSLLCWTEDPGLVTISGKRTSVVFNAFKAIRSCLFHAQRALVALSTDDELVVYSLEEQRPLLQIPRRRA
jgi:hypothetical protein